MDRPERLVALRRFTVAHPMPNRRQNSVVFHVAAVWTVHAALLGCGASHPHAPSLSSPTHAPTEATTRFSDDDRVQVVKAAGRDVWFLAAGRRGYLHAGKVTWSPDGCSASPLQIVETSSGWLLLTRDGRLFRTADFTARLEPLAELDLALGRRDDPPGSVSYGRLAFQRVDGTLVTTTGGDLESLSSLPTNDLVSVLFANEHDGLAMLHQGVLLRTTDAGAHWTAVDLGPDAALMVHASREGFRVNSTRGDLWIDPLGHVTTLQAGVESPSVSIEEEDRDTINLAVLNVIPWRVSARRRSTVIAMQDDTAWVHTLDGVIKHVNEQTLAVLHTDTEFYGRACHLFRWKPGAGVWCLDGGYPRTHTVYRWKDNRFSVTATWKDEAGIPHVGDRIWPDQSSGRGAVINAPCEPRHARQDHDELCAVYDGEAPVPFELPGPTWSAIALWDGRLVIEDVSLPHPRSSRQVLDVRNGSAQGDGTSRGPDAATSAPWTTVENDDVRIDLQRTIEWTDAPQGSSLWSELPPLPPRTWYAERVSQHHLYDDGHSTLPALSFSVDHTPDTVPPLVAPPAQGAGTTPVGRLGVRAWITVGPGQHPRHATLRWEGADAEGEYSRQLNSDILLRSFGHDYNGDAQPAGWFSLGATRDGVLLLDDRIHAREGLQSHVWWFGTNGVIRDFGEAGFTLARHPTLVRLAGRNVVLIPRVVEDPGWPPDRYRAEGRTVIPSLSKEIPIGLQVMEMLVLDSHGQTQAQRRFRVDLEGAFPATDSGRMGMVFPSPFVDSSVFLSFDAPGDWKQWPSPTTSAISVCAPNTQGPGEAPTHALEVRHGVRQLSWWLDVELSNAIFCIRSAHSLDSGLVVAAPGGVLTGRFGADRATTVRVSRLSASPGQP